MMNRSALPSLLLLLAGLLTVTAVPAGTLGYPDMENPSFLVDVPDDWEITPGDGEGDFGHVNSDSGVYLAFRTLEGSADSGKAAMEETIVYVQENYQDVQLSEPKETQQAGMPAFLIDGTGTDADGADVIFRMAWIKLTDGLVAEIWFAAPADDVDGIQAAGAALSSFRAP
jgi:hypothetical protein